MKRGTNRAGQLRKGYRYLKGGRVVKVKAHRRSCPSRRARRR